MAYEVRVEQVDARPVVSIRERVPRDGISDATWRAAGPGRELCWTDPVSEPNPEKWRTEVIEPLADAG